MDKSDFEAFVRRENETAARRGNETSDIETEKEEWLQYLGKLYESVRVFLSEWLDAGQVEIDTKKIEIFEEQTGSYIAPQMEVMIGLKVIKLVPIGTFIIGAKGRVDVVGPAGTARLILTDKEVKHPSQLIRISVHLVGKKSAPPSSPPSKKPTEIQWTWKIIERPPKLDFQDLSKDRFLNLLLEVGNG